MSTFRSWKGQHSLKAGAQYEQTGEQCRSGRAVPEHRSSTGTTSFQPVAGGPPQRGTYGYYNASRNFTIGDVTSHNVGLFLQDQWSVNNRLTFNMGLRADRTYIPSYRPENPSLSFSFAQKIAPRIGAAYDVNGDGRWKAYGSWGIFYDIEKLDMPRGAWGADKWIDYTYTLDTFDWKSSRLRRRVRGDRLSGNPDPAPRPPARLERARQLPCRSGPQSNEGAGSDPRPRS